MWLVCILYENGLLLWRILYINIYDIFVLYSDNTIRKYSYDMHIHIQTTGLVSVKTSYSLVSRSGSKYKQNVIIW